MIKVISLGHFMIPIFNLGKQIKSERSFKSNEVETVAVTVFSHLFVERRVLGIPKNDVRGNAVNLADKLYIILTFSNPRLLLLRTYSCLN